MMPMFAILLLSAVTPLSGSWAQFDRVGQLDGNAERVEFANDGIDPATHQVTIKLRYTYTTLHDSKTLWTDNRRCPAIRAVLIGMRDLQMPKPKPYGVPTDGGKRMLDGTAYALTAPSTFTDGKLTIESNVESPLALWIDSALKMLEPCWSPTEPTR